MMENPRRHLALFERVIQKGDFAPLNDFEQNASWGTLSGEEKELLGLLFAWRGDRFLADGCGDEAERSFSLAQQVAPSSADIAYWQGVAWLKASRRGASEALSRACKSFELAAQRDSGSGAAWHGWGVALARLEDFDRSEECFAKGEQLLDGRALAQLYWDWGSARCLAGRLSEEAIDFRGAVERFAQAEETGLDDTAFWLDYGKALTVLGHLVGDPTLLEKALPCFSRVVEQSRDSAEGWGVLAQTFRCLFTITSSEEHLIRAQDCFEQAERLGASESVSIGWAELLQTAGERRSNPQMLEEAMNRLRGLGEEHFDQPEVIGLVARILSTLGLLADNLELIHEAKKRAQVGVEMYPEQPILWCRYGECLAAEALYFSDVKLYREAADRFAHALTLNSRCFPAHLGLAEASYAIGGLTGDPAFMEKAAQRAELIATGERLNAEAWRLWGLSLMRLSEAGGSHQLAGDAVDKLGRAIALRGGLEGSPEVDWVLDYGAALDQLGMMMDDDSAARRAVQVFSRMHQLHPEDLDIRFRLAAAWFHLGEVAEDSDCIARSMDHFEALAVRDPDDELVWDEWGCALLHLARLIDEPLHPGEAQRLRRDADSKLQRAVGLGCGDALYHLAWLHAQEGRDEVAIECLRRSEAAGSLPPRELMLQDEWLRSLHDSDQFHQFLQEID
jgi:tetratricopeptide (TPR) repeat protein